MATRLRAARTTRTGVAVSHDMIHIRMKPKINVPVDTMTTPIANWTLVRLPFTNSEIAIRLMPTRGPPDPSSHTIIVRPMIPGAKRCGGGAASSACAATGRSANSVSR
ncbi:hypothetical protein DL240490_01267 [Mycobacterium marinum]|nr:hypothetical protein DL240490_01267 [Mycobacterium marinum]